MRGTARIGPNGPVSHPGAPFVVLLANNLVSKCAGYADNGF
jgi:hypothetical protein